MPRNAVAYDEDFFAWTQEQARLLRAGELAVLDAENLAEEIESVGASDRREIRSRLAVLLTHLLKWKFQPEAKGPSCLGTMGEQRYRIELVLTDSPSLRPFVSEALQMAYRKARKDAATETGLAESVFPIECPFSEKEILSEEFLPE